MYSVFDYLIALGGGFFVGFVNAIAGGGTLISFPVLTLIGLPVVSANVTSTVSLSPGYLAATFAQLKDLKDQKKRLLIFIPLAALGGILGGILLLQSGDRVFRSLVPYLILVASALLALQEPLKKWLNKHQKLENRQHAFSIISILAIGLAAIYGGYFGAGLSVIVLAVLALSISDTLTRLNALKQIIGFSANMSTAIFFMFSNHVEWDIVLFMASGAIAGGWAGGKLAAYIKPVFLRRIVVIIGFVVSIVYFIK